MIGRSLSHDWKLALADVRVVDEVVVLPSCTVRAVVWLVAGPTLRVWAEPDAVATGATVIDVALARAVILAPCAMFVPVIVRPTSPAWKLAVADVTVPEPDVVTPSVTVREVVFSSVHFRPVKVPVALALSTA